MTREEAVAILKPFMAYMYDQDGCPISNVAIALDVAISALEQPEIIHCRDCKHWREGDAYSYCQKLFNMGVLNAYDYMMAEDDFCSRAERREEGGK